MDGQQARRTETIYYYVDRCTQITIGKIARLQRDGGLGYAYIYDKDPEDVMAAFVIKRITDGRGRYWKCDGKLTIHDRAFGETDYPLEWRQSNLGNGGFWVIVGAGHYARKLYRTPRGWRTLQEYRTARTDYDFESKSYRGHVVYEAQSWSRDSREGRGLLGAVRAGVYADLALEVYGDKYRKPTYRDKLTPYGKRMRKRFLKYKPAFLHNLRQRFPDLTPWGEMDCIRYVLVDRGRREEKAFEAFRNMAAEQRGDFGRAIVEGMTQEKMLHLLHL